MGLGGLFSSALLALLGTLTLARGEKSLYDFTVTGLNGEDIPLSRYKSKPVVLVVNVARCVVCEHAFH
jgi:hypothetical protein